MLENHTERQYYQAQHRAYQEERQSYHHKGLGTLLVVLLIIGITAHLWVILPLILFMFPLLLFWIMPAMFIRVIYQTPYQLEAYQPYQPYQQLDSEPPVYQPYTEGYQPQQSTYQQPAEAYEERSQPEYQNLQTQQYEEPMTMYPRE